MARGIANGFLRKTQGHFLSNLANLHQPTLIFLSKAPAIFELHVGILATLLAAATLVALAEEATEDSAEKALLTWDVASTAAES